MATQPPSSDELFFKQVLMQDVLQAAMAQQQIDNEKVYGPIAGRNSGLKLWRSSWVLPTKDSAQETVCIHFESRHRGRMQVDVEIHPYEPGIDKDPQRQEELKQQLELKSTIQTSIRDKLMADSSLSHLGVNTKGLRATSGVSTLCAIKFDVGLSEDCEPMECAEFFAKVIKQVTPVINAILANLAVDA